MAHLTVAMLEVVMDGLVIIVFLLMIARVAVSIFTR